MLRLIQVKSEADMALIFILNYWMNINVKYPKQI